MLKNRQYVYLLVLTEFKVCKSPVFQDFKWLTPKGHDIHIENQTINNGPTKTLVV
jgi:hypothetical protein